MQKEAAERIKERGFKLIISDMNPACYCSKYADEFVELNTFDIEGNLQAAAKLKKKYHIKAVFTAGADCHETVAHLAKYLGLHGISPKISHICRYKSETRRVLTKKGVPQPAFRTAKNFAEFTKAVDEVGLPVAVKSSNNSGSRGFAFLRAKKDVTEDKFKTALDAGTSGYVIVEELLIPSTEEIAEQSVETLWYNGKMYWLNWVDRMFRNDMRFFPEFEDTKGLYNDLGWGVEIGHINPARHDIATQQQVHDLIYQAGLAIGMGKEKGGHVLKADIMLTKKGPQIIELTPRLSGGWDSSMTTPSRGANFVGGFLALALGEKLDLDMWTKYFAFKDPNLYASVLAKIKVGATDSIGREFAVATDFDLNKSLQKVYQKVVSKKYIA
jgi:biotin carboxylase